MFIQAESFSTWHSLLRYHVFLSQKKNLFCRICSLIRVFLLMPSRTGPSPRQPGKDCRVSQPSRAKPRDFPDRSLCKGSRGLAPREALLAGSALATRQPSLRLPDLRRPHAHSACQGQLGGRAGGLCVPAPGCANLGFSPVASTGFSVRVSSFSPPVWQHTRRTHIQIR